jgi:hypothetical protein
MLLLDTLSELTCLRIMWAANKLSRVGKFRKIEPWFPKEYRHWLVRIQATLHADRPHAQKGKLYLASNELGHKNLQAPLN